MGHSNFCSGGFVVFKQIPEPDVSILGIHIDPDGAYLAAVNSKVHLFTNAFSLTVVVLFNYTHMHPLK